MLNPTCPECGELLGLATIAELLWDYVPVPPASMRRYFDQAGPDALAWECFGGGCFWSPARVADLSSSPA